MKNLSRGHSHSLKTLGDLNSLVTSQWITIPVDGLGYFYLIGEARSTVGAEGQNSNPRRSTSKPRSSYKFQELAVARDAITALQAQIGSLERSP